MKYLPSHALPVFVAIWETAEIKFKNIVFYRCWHGWNKWENLYMLALFGAHFISERFFVYWTKYLQSVDSYNSFQCILLCLRYTLNYTKHASLWKKEDKPVKRNFYCKRILLWQVRQSNLRFALNIKFAEPSIFIPTVRFHKVTAHVWIWINAEQCSSLLNETFCNSSTIDQTLSNSASDFTLFWLKFLVKTVIHGFRYYFRRWW